MKNKKLIFNISITIASVLILAIITLVLLGKKERIGYLSEFNLDINNTLQLNALDINETKLLFTIDNKLDKTSITNFIFTNTSITNYSYNFRIKYYSKIFRNSDIYGVYIDTNKVTQNNDFIKEIKFNYKGSPFGTLTSTKELNIDNKIDNTNYTLSFKWSLINYIILFIIFLIIFFYIKNIYIKNIKKLKSKSIKRIIHKIINIINTTSNSISMHKEYIISFVVFFPFIIIIYQFLSYSFPYYYSWDSTKIYTNDILLACSNISPEVMLNSNTIYYIFFKYIFIPFGKIFNLIGITNIDQLENNLNPYLSFVELSEYILLVQQILFLLFIAFLYINIIKIMKIHYFNNKKVILYIISLLVLIASSIILNTTFIYNTIRYETAGLLLPLISLYFILSSSEKNIHIDSNMHRLYIILSGIFVGFALFTKILFIFYIVFLFFIYIIFNIDKYINFEKNDDINFNVILKFLYFILISLILTSIVVFIYIKNALLKTSFMDIMYEQTDKFIFSLSILPLFLLILIIFTSLVNKNKIKTSYKFKIFLYNSLLYLLSFISIVFLSFLLPEIPDSFINTYLFSYAGGSTVILTYISVHYLIIGLIFIIVSSLIIIKYFNIFSKIISKLISITKNINILKIILSILLVFLVLFLDRFFRNDEKDIILSNTMYVLAFFILYRNILNLKIHTKLFLLLLILILSLYSIININQFNNYNSKLVQNQNFVDKSAYVYTQKEWKDFTHFLTSAKIVNIMNKVYNTEESWDSVFYWSRNVQMVKRLIKQIEITDNSLLHTSIANTGSVITHQLDVISSIDNNIKGGIIIPLTDISNNVYLRDDYDFYYISDTKYKKEDSRITYLNYDFSVNNNKYFVYKLSMSTWLELMYGYDGNFTFIKDEDFTNAFILINDKLAKKL